MAVAQLQSGCARLLAKPVGSDILSPCRSVIAPWAFGGRKWRPFFHSWSSDQQPP
ncbi:hypothetical protein HMPREF3150_02081 [Pseudomonas aeruginosa]|nr:hypothetical protein HMPREF3150_02081 [Pseudomonas aeruginosa]